MLCPSHVHVFRSVGQVVCKRKTGACLLWGVALLGIAPPPPNPMDNSQLKIKRKKREKEREGEKGDFQLVIDLVEK